MEAGAAPTVALLGLGDSRATREEVVTSDPAHVVTSDRYATISTRSPKALPPRQLRILQQLQLLSGSSSSTTAS